MYMDIETTPIEQAQPQAAPYPIFNNPALLDRNHRYNESVMYIMLKDMDKELSTELLSYSAEMLLDMAIESETTAKDVGYKDPAFAHFTNHKTQFLKLAGYVEYRRQYLHLLAP